MSEAAKSESLSLAASHPDIIAVLLDFCPKAKIDSQTTSPLAKLPTA